MPLSDAIIAGLTGIVGPGQVLTKPEDVIPYGFDGTAALQQRPEAVVFPLSTSDVSRCVQLAASESVPIVTRGSGTGLSGGSVPSEGAMVMCLAQMNAYPRRRSAEPHAPRTARRHDDHDRRGGRATWAVLSAGSRVDAHQHHRRQRGGELRRAARPEVRRHARLCDGDRSRAGRRSNHAVREPLREGRRRLLDEGPVRRIGRARSASSPRCC